MGTEDIRIEGGRLTVERPVAHKDNIDVDMSTVESVYFERSPDAAADGALVLTTRDGENHLIRVSNEDDHIYADVYDAWRAARVDSTKGQPDLLSELDNGKTDQTEDGNKPPVPRALKGAPVEE